MRFRLVCRSLALAALLVPLAAAAGCSSSNGGGVGPDTDGGTTDPGTTNDGGTKTDGATGGDGATQAPPNDCKLAEISGVADVKPAFLVYEPPGTAPPTMTGGTLSGKYIVDKATVYLPTQTKGLADPTKSEGTVNAWAVFSGTSYRLYLKASFTISSVLGPQSQGSDVASQGGFTVATSALTLDHACDAKPPQEASYTFTDTGSGRATILIKTATMYGDTYLQLDAAKK